MRESAFWLYHRRIRRTNLRGLLDEYRTTQYWTEDQLRDYQMAALRRLLTHCAEKVPYYKLLFRQLGIDPRQMKEPEDIRSIPLLTKETIKANLDSMITEGVDKTTLRLNSTSGSTGASLYFYSDLKTRTCQALQLRADEWMGIGLFDPELRIWGARWDVSALAKVVPRMQNAFLRRRVLSGYRLSDEDVAGCLALIRRTRPALLHSYPSILYLLASRWTGEPPRGLRAIRSAGEKLFDFQREKIEERFGCRVFDFYGARDIPIIAQECSAHQGLHVNVENVVLEVVDESGQPLEEGEGDLVLTHLNNSVMPFVRYRIGDRAKITRRRCPCGRGLPLLEEVTGRGFDVITFPNGNRVGGTFWTLLVKSGEGAKHVGAFQVVQTDPCSIVVRYSGESALPPSEEDRIRSCVEEYSGPKLRLEFQHVQEISPTSGGKWRFVVGCERPGSGHERPDAP